MEHSRPCIFDKLFWWIVVQISPIQDFEHPWLLEQAIIAGRAGKSSVGAFDDGLDFINILSIQPWWTRWLINICIAMSLYTHIPQFDVLIKNPT